MNHLTLADASSAADAGRAAAAGLGVASTIVLLDAGGDVVLVVRMDRAWPGAFDLACAKAATARAFQASSGSFEPLVQPGAPLFGVGSVRGGRYLPLPGGEPLRLSGTMIGAVGVSGGTPSEDQVVANAVRMRFEAA